MALSDTGSRRLPYPLSKTFEPVSETPNEPIENTIIAGFPDETTRVNVTLNLSLDEYVALATAIDVGRDIAFAEDSELIWWTWVRAFQEGTVMACEDIADCIDTSEDVQNAITTNQNILIQQLMQNANSGLTYPPIADTESTILNTQGGIGASKDDEIKELESCNLDALWAGIRDGIVQRLDDNARSTLEYLVSKADAGERATALIGAIPIFGSMAKAVLDQMVQLAPDMLNLYESYSSLENMDEIACEIFGMVCSSCRYPTYDEVYQYYASAGITGLTDIDDIVIAAATDLLFGSTELAALAFYHTLITYQLLVLYLGSKFYSYTASSALLTMASLGEDFANDNWEILCDSCDDAYRLKIWDFTQSDAGSYRTSSYPTTSGHGIYIAGTGWIPQQLGAEGNGFISVGVALKPEWRIRAIGLKFANQASGNGNMTYNILRPTPAVNAGGTPVALDWGTTGWTYYENGLAAITAIKEYGISYSTQLNLNRAWTHFGVIFDKDYAPDDAMPINDPNFSATVFP
jgi:hypothetical protein